MPDPSLIDGHTHIGVDPMFYLRGHYPYALDWPTLQHHGDLAGIGRFVVFPMVTHLALGIPGMRKGEITTDGALETVPYAFENRRMMNEIHTLFPDSANRALPLWMIDPSREAKAQVKALRELRQDFPQTGLKIQATVIQSPILDLLETGACLMDLAEEFNLPVLIHSSINPNDCWSAAGDILKVVEARPHIRFSLAHSCRFDKPSLDRIAELPNAWFDCSAHRIHCQLAVMEGATVATPARRFPSDYTNPAKVLADLASAYPEKLIWGSDAPFDSYVDENVQLLSSYRLEAETLHTLDDAVKTRIARDNTLAFLYGPRGAKQPGI